MAEDPSDYENFYKIVKDRHNSSIKNVITKVPVTQPIDIIKDFDQLIEPRRIEHECLIQHSLPTLQRSYGSIYSKSGIISESTPLLRTKDGYQSYFCNERIELSRYRRTQIFLFFYIVFYVLYLIVGSICFQKLETGVEQEIREEFRDERRKFLEEHPTVEGCCFCFGFVYIVKFILL